LVEGIPGASIALPYYRKASEVKEEDTKGGRGDIKEEGIRRWISRKNISRTRKDVGSIEQVDDR
jgi:hypothetical protein